MNKLPVMLLTATGLLAAGLALSFYGSQVVTEGLITETGIAGPEQSMRITVELDPGVAGTAVYVVQVMSLEGSQVSANIADPLGTQIEKTDIDRDSYESRFEITDAGPYTLTISNPGQATEVVALLGHMPGTEAFSIGFTGFYILLAGLAAMVVLTIYAIKGKRQLR